MDNDYINSPVSIEHLSSILNVLRNLETFCCCWLENMNMQRPDLDVDNLQRMSLNFKVKTTKLRQDTKY